ncbi:MAG: 2-C-methyl-D-erythritol 4-phosphate cytidylyltransferase, partial [Longimicrobiales bacterium]
MRRIAVVIPAAGGGRRMGGVAKPLLELAGQSLLQRCIQPFLDRADVHWIVVAMPPELAAAPPDWLMSHRRIDIVAGGSERGDSVRNALAAVPTDA